ncbi:MAG: NAD(P)-dependent alcohol dehydrogenase [bacterium]
MPSTKAYAAHKVKEALKPFTFDRREPREHDVVVNIKYCGVCHSDIHQARDEWGGSRFPMVPGHEIAGLVERVGSKVGRFKVGDRVGVGVMVDSCRHCGSCEKHLEQYCVEGMTGTYNAIERDGVTVSQGGYSERIVVDERFVLNIPDALPLDAAAPLLCAGITVYSPLKHWKAGPDRRVAVVGLGGLGHMAVKFAHALGADVTVLSRSLNKETDSRRLGADHYYATEDPKTFQRLARSFDLIVNTVSAELDWNAYLSLLNVDGTLVILGIPGKPNPIHAFSVINGRKSLAGSMIGGIQETQEMLDFCGRHGIAPDIEVIPIQKVNEAYERVLNSDVRYRFVLDLATLKNG